MVASASSAFFVGSFTTRKSAAWSFEGNALPFFDFENEIFPSETLGDGRTGLRSAVAYSARIAELSEEEKERWIIPLTKITAPVLFVGGSDDGLWPVCQLANIAIEELERNQHESHESKCYENAGHLLGYYGWITTQSYAAGTGDPATIYGGTPRGTADAQRQIQKDITTFFNTALQQ